MCRLFLSFVLQFEIQLSRGESCDPMNRFINAIFFVPVLSQDMDFQCHMSWAFLCSVIEGEMRDGCCFADIG